MSSQQVTSETHVNHMLIKYITHTNRLFCMNLELINWIKDGKYRIRTLELLCSKSLLSSELAHNLGINRASMSRILKVLRERDLVSPVSERSRTVTYRITEKGVELLKIIKGSRNA